MEFMMHACRTSESETSIEGYASDGQSYAYRNPIVVYSDVITRPCDSHIHAVVPSVLCTYWI